VTGYKKIKQLKKETGIKIPDLLALAPANDPFFTGSPSAKIKAEWFANLWHKFGYTGGVHLRRFHYQLVSQKEPKKHDGKPYKNTESDWQYLLTASKYARHLGLVDPRAFIDRRNPEPHIFRPEPSRYCQSPAWEYYFWDWLLPSVNIELVNDLDWELPFFYPIGYEYNESLQPYHLEIWVEKSTMDDILIPLCQKYSVNLVTGIGFMSITSVINLLERVKQQRKPCRIFYVSDFDPAGAGMPIAVARQIEYYLEKEAVEVDIKLNPIVLMKDQVIKYKLPRIPIKDTDRRKANFEEKFGEGAVELDALEALHPGTLAKIIEENILQFRDEKLSGKLNKVRNKAVKELKSWWKDIIEPYQEALDDLKNKVKAVTGKYQQQIDEIKMQMEIELEPFKDEIDSLRQAIQNKINDIAPDLPELPEPEITPQEDDWLFDSSRDYFEQLAAYKTRKTRGW